MYTPRRSEVLWPYSPVEEESFRKFYASSPCRAKPGRLPSRVACDAALNPDGEWNEYEIRVEADRIIVFLNDVKINEWVDDDPNVDLAQGYIGIQNHGSSGADNPDDVYFRNIRISEGTANTQPVATNDSARAKTGRSVAIDVLANDTDAEGDSLAVAGASDPAHGTASVQANGTILYTSDKRFKGTDTFTYTATDGQAESAPATVTIQVTASKPKGG